MQATCSMVKSTVVTDLVCKGELVTELTEGSSSSIIS